MPVIPEQHSDIRRQCDTCVKNFRCKFPHPLHTVVHIKDRLRHDIPFSFFRKVHPALSDKAVIKNPLHSPVHIVRKTPDIEPLDISGNLHGRNGRHIGTHQKAHAGKCPGAV